MKTWKELSIRDKNDIIKVAVQNGISNLDDIRARYNEFAEGGNLYWDGGVQQADNTNVDLGIVPNLPTDDSTESKFYRDLAALSTINNNESQKKEFFPIHLNNITVTPYGNMIGNFTPNTEIHYNGNSAADIVFNNPNLRNWSDSNIREFQELMGLDKDGLIGPLTRGAFNNVKNKHYRVQPTNSTQRIIDFGSQFHPDESNAEFDWSIMPELNSDDGCSRWVTKKYEAVTGDADKAGFYADAWQLLKKIEKAGGAMLFNAYTDDVFKEAKTGEQIKSITKKYLKDNPIDYSQLEAGDVVGMFYPGSSHYDDVLENGTTLNTHVGIIVGKDKDDTPLVQHFVGGSVFTDRVDNPSFGMKITAAVRPNQIKNIEPKWNIGTSKYYLADPNKKGYNNSNMVTYMNSLDGAKETLAEVFPDVDIDELEKRAIGIMKRETDFMTRTQKDIRENWSSPIDASLAVAREIKKDMEGIPESRRSSNLTKTKPASLSTREKVFLGIHSNKDLEKPEIAARAVLYILARNADYFTNLSKVYPTLGLTEDDINNAATLSYNQGMLGLQTLGFDKNGKYAPSEIQELRNLSYLDADRIKDYKSTNYKHIPFGETLFNLFGGEGNYPYISAARNAVENYVIPKNQ